MAAHKIGVQYRDAELEASSIDKDKRTASFSFSSEYPVERSFGMEVLDHSPGAADLSRINGKGPVLLDHDSTQLVGVVEHAEIKDRRGMARVRFSRNVLGEQVFNDVVDGIRNNVSFGYRIHEARKEMDRDGQEVVRVTRFEPLEISMVGVPADPTVGMGRAYEITIQESLPIMTDPIPPAPQPPFDAAAAEKRIRAEVIAEQKREQEIVRNRDAEIDAIVTRWNNPAITNLAKDFRNTGGTIDEFKRALHDTIAKRPEALNVVPSEGMSNRDLKNYSFTRAILNSIPRERGGGGGLSTFEREMSDEVAKRTGRSPQGFYIPSDVLHSRVLEVGTFTGAGALVQSSTGGQSLIELLRNRMTVAQMGATMLGGLQGDVDIPRQTGGGTASWLSESAELSRVDQTVGQLALRPHRLAASTAFSKQLLAQSTPDVEAFVRNDLMAVIAIAKDLAALNGSGVSGQPLGIINTTGLSTAVSHTAATSFTWGMAVEYETNVEANNALGASMGYVMRPGVKSIAKTTVKNSGGGGFVWENNTVNDYKAMSTTQLPTTAGACVFGNWADLVLADWDGMDVVVDPYSLSLKGQISIVIQTLCDVGIRHAASFCINNA